MSDFFDVAGVEEVIASFSWLKPLETEEVPLAEALDRVLAEEVVAGADVPHFPRSAMDGYAVRAADTFGCSEGQPAYLDRTGTVEMGKAVPKGPGPGETFGISTGGMMPPGTDGVVMWEYTREKEGLVEVFRPIAPGEHMIRVGEDVSQGERILPAGRRLRPADIGLLSGLGFSAIKAYRKPKVAIISTGDELVEAAETPGEGRVRNVNQHSLGSLAKRRGAEAILMGIVPDEFDKIEERLREGLEKADMIIISGGSSRGVRDFTRRAVEGLGEPGLLFHGLAVRPGKPTVVGAQGRKPVLGLPGHPLSAMVIFLILVAPLLEMMQGIEPGSEALRVPARLKDNLSGQAGREDYYQVRLEYGQEGMEATPLFRKSGLVSAMVRGEGMIRVPREREGLEAGSIVDVEILR